MTPIQQSSAAMWKIVEAFNPTEESTKFSKDMAVFLGETMGPGEGVRAMTMALVIAAEGLNQAIHERGRHPAEIPGIDGLRDAVAGLRATADLFDLVVKAAQS